MKIKVKRITGRGRHLGLCTITSEQDEESKRGGRLMEKNWEAEKGQRGRMRGGDGRGRVGVVRG